MKFNTDNAAAIVSVGCALGIALVAAAGITLIKRRQKRDILRMPDYDMPPNPDTMTRRHVRPEIEPMPVFPESHTLRPQGNAPNINQASEQEDAVQLGLELGDKQNAH